MTVCTHRGDEECGSFTACNTRLRTADDPKAPCLCGEEVRAELKAAEEAK